MKGYIIVGSHGSFKVDAEGHPIEFEHPTTPKVDPAMYDGIKIIQVDIAELRTWSDAHNLPLADGDTIDIISVGYHWQDGEVSGFEEPVKEHRDLIAGGWRTFSA